MDMLNDFYPVILAGGSGTRLWPRSRRNNPKQFLRFNSPRTLVQETYARLASLVPSDHIYVVTNQRFVPRILEQLPDVPPANVLGEPEGRNTAPAIGWASALIRRRDPQAVTALLPADHIITRVDEFRRVMRAAVAIAREGRIVTLGIAPTEPATGYGYIERGERLGEYEGFQVFRLVRFTEKPDRETAEHFLKTGRYSWNSGMFIWQAGRLLAEIQAHMPDLYAGLNRILEAWDTPERDRVLREVWPTLPNTSVDYGVMEHVTDGAVIPVDIGWNDVGSWEAVYQEYDKDAAGNAVEGETLLVDTRESLVLSDGRLLAVMGMSGLIVVETEDAILICPRDRAQDVRKVVEELKRRRAEQYL